MQPTEKLLAHNGNSKEPFGDLTNNLNRVGKQMQGSAMKAHIQAFCHSGIPASALAALKGEAGSYSAAYQAEDSGARNERALGSAAILNPGEEQNDVRPSTLLRTCASVTDLDMASVHSASRSSITAACFALKGGLGLSGEKDNKAGNEHAQRLIRSTYTCASEAGASESDASAVWSPRSCMARLHSKSTKGSSAGKMSPRSCISTLPGLRAGGKRRLPMWARALSNASNSHPLEEWNQQQSLLASMHLHPHEEDQQAELSTIGDSLSAFADDMQTLEDAGPEEAQRNEDTQSSREEETARATDPPTPVSSKPPGLLSQALRAAEKAVAPKQDTMQNTTTERPRDLGSLRPNAKTTSVADLVRIWQHQPMTVHSLPKQQSASGSGTPHERGAPGRGYISPLVLSKVQSYLDTAASPSGMRAPAGTAGAVVAPSMPVTARSMTAEEQAQRTQWWGKQGLLFSEKRSGRRKVK
ncbi:g10325 [Coccomyxa elongata]